MCSLLLKLWFLFKRGKKTKQNVIYVKRKPGNKNLHWGTHYKTPAVVSRPINATPADWWQVPHEPLLSQPPPKIEALASAVSQSVEPEGTGPVSGRRQLGCDSNCFQ